MTNPGFQLPSRGDKGTYVRKLFARITPVYDLLNHLLSLGLDIHWRRVGARSMPLEPGQRVLDLCCGTGDLTRAVLRRCPQVHVTAVDFCEPMVVRARTKLADLASSTHLLVGDGLCLPFPDNHFDHACVAFGVRNFADPRAGLREIARVLRPGGWLMVLEFGLPTFAPLRWAYRAYFEHVLPLIGRLVSRDRDAYSYLPASVLEFPHGEGFLEWMGESGYGELACQGLTGGVVVVYRGKVGDGERGVGEGESEGE